MNLYEQVRRLTLLNKSLEKQIQEGGKVEEGLGNNVGMVGGEKLRMFYEEQLKSYENQL